MSSASVRLETLAEERVHDILASSNQDDALFELGVRSSVQRACRLAATCKRLRDVSRAGALWQRFWKMHMVSVHSIAGKLDQLNKRAPSSLPIGGFQLCHMPTVALWQDEPSHDLFTAYAVRTQQVPGQVMLNINRVWKWAKPGCTFTPLRRSDGPGQAACCNKSPWNENGQWCMMPGCGLSRCPGHRRFERDRMRRGLGSASADTLDRGCERGFVLFTRCSMCGLSLCNRCNETGSSASQPLIAPACCDSTYACCADCLLAHHVSCSRCRCGRAPCSFCVSEPTAQFCCRFCTTTIPGACSSEPTRDECGETARADGHLGFHADYDSDCHGYD